MCPLIIVKALFDSIKYNELPHRRPNRILLVFFQCLFNPFAAAALLIIISLDTLVSFVFLSVSLHLHRNVSHPPQQHNTIKYSTENDSNPTQFIQRHISYAFCGTFLLLLVTRTTRNSSSRIEVVPAFPVPLTESLSCDTRGRP